MTFENIFSKKEKQIKENSKQPNPKNPIIIDTREKQSLIAANLLQKNANIKFELLEIGDYLINNIIIERKTLSDLLQSMINKRLFNQLQEIKKYPHYILLVEGNKETEIPENMKNPFKGLLLSIITQDKIPIIFTKNQEETADYLILLAKKFEKQIQEAGIRQSKSQKPLQEQKQFILEGFPGIGPKLAKQLIKDYSSLNKIFALSIEELRLIKGFDDNKIKKFRQLLGS